VVKLEGTIGRNKPKENRQELRKNRIAVVAVSPLSRLLISTFSDKRVHRAEYTRSRTEISMKTHRPTSVSSTDQATLRTGGQRALREPLGCRAYRFGLVRTLRGRIRNSTCIGCARMPLKRARISRISLLRIHVPVRQFVSADAGSHNNKRGHA